MLSGLGLVVATALVPLSESTRSHDGARAATLRVAPAQEDKRTARSLARASRAAESVGDLPAALDLARESYVLRPSRRALHRVDGLNVRLQVGTEPR